MLQRHRIIDSMILLFVSMQLIATGCTLGLERKFELVPIFHTIPGNVGMFVEKSFQFNADPPKFFEGTVDREFRETSVSLFSQIFESMFENISVLPKWSPLMAYENDLDGIIQLKSSSIELFAIGKAPVVVTVSYTVCLYKPDGDQINCWTTSVNASRGRSTFDPYAVKFTVEEAMRAAIADFMVTFEKDVLIKKWKSYL